MDARTIEYALMAGSAYFSTRGDINRIPLPGSWQPLNPAAGLDHIISGTGFEARAFQQGDEIVIAFAGTVELIDWLSGNAPLVAGVYSPQLSQAAAYYQEIKAANPNANISFTGHSLGGGLAALMGVLFNRGAITFDAAPFRRAANMVNQAIMTVDLVSQGYGFDADLASFLGLAPIIRGERNIESIAVEGEILTNLFSNAF